MRSALTIVMMAALWGGWASCGMAADPKATKSPGNKVEARADSSGNAELRAEIHRTVAALIEAQAAEKPDRAKVDALTEKLQQLRGKLVATRVTTTDGAQAVGGCPWGGPGPGYGLGAGWGRGGRGGGFGPGGGRGWGGGYGQGFGPGAGQGRAPGGAAFVDKDNDGVCDYYELRQGMHK